MDRARRGLTLIELLAVISVISILMAMMSPILLRAQQEAVRKRCGSNLRQMHTVLELLRNDRQGRFPNCFDLKPGTDEVDEASWWYREIVRAAYPHDDEYDMLTVPRADSAWWDANPRTDLAKFPPDGMIPRCPASMDYHDDRHAPSSVPTCYEIDKDRVYDDNYGYNNFGFRYDPAVRTIHLPDGPNAIDTTYLYHRPNAAGLGGRDPMEAIRGQLLDTPASIHIGARADLVDPAGTILLMDYIKADAQPFPGVDGLYGYRFRHGERANVLFADGHAEGFRKRHFLARVGGPDLHWEVKPQP